MINFRMSKKSKANLDTCHPDLKNVAIDGLALSTVDFSVVEGRRSKGQQAANIAAGVSWTMKSKHLVQEDGTAWAFDAYPWVRGASSFEVEDLCRMAVAIRAAAVQRGVTILWGGYWDAPLNDLPGDLDSLIAIVKARIEARKEGNLRRTFDGVHFQKEG